MGITYAIDPETGTLLTEVYGAVNAADLMRHLGEVLDDARVTAPVRELWDGRGITTFDVTAADVRVGASAVEASPEKLGGGRLAVVAPADLVFGMSRILQALVDGGALTVDVFREMSEARAWIGMPPETTNP